MNLKQPMAPASELTPGYRADTLRRHIAKLADELSSPREITEEAILELLLEVAVEADRYLAEQTDKEPLL